MDDDEEFKQYLDANKWDCIPDEFVVFDLETTGLTPQTDRIVEIGAILFRKDLYLKSGEVNQFQCFVKQEKPIPKEAIAIHGITDDMVVDGDSEYAALTEFFMFIGNLPLYAYNAKFDKNFIQATAKRCGYFDEDFKFEVEDVMPLVSQVFDDLPNRKLQTVAQRIGHPIGNAHRALGDCAMALHLFINCTQKLMIQQSAYAREEYLDLKRKTEELEREIHGDVVRKKEEENETSVKMFKTGLVVTFVLLIFILLLKK